MYIFSGRAKLIVPFAEYAMTEQSQTRTEMRTFWDVRTCALQQVSLT